ncbi:hypothetical protein F4703DRAFT_1733681, partial [Phycomyces blakesleeanus]
VDFFYEGSRGGIVDDSGNEAAVFVVDSSFRLADLTNLNKFIKNEIKSHHRKRRAKRHGYAGSNRQEGKKLNL